MSVQSNWHKTKYFFLGNPVKPGPDWQDLRIKGKGIFSPLAQLKLEWIIFYHTQAKRSAILTARHFGMTRKTIHKWLERFNRTIQEEFMEMSDIDPLFTEDFNQALTDWLIEYNFRRPHQTLDYKTPLQYLNNYYLKVSPMYSSLTQLIAKKIKYWYI